MATETKASLLAEYIGATHVLGSGTINNPNNALNQNPGGSNKVQFCASNQNNGDFYVEYRFGFPEIPAGATIDSVVCRVGCYLASGTASYANVTAQAFSGSAEKGSAASVTSTTTTNVQSLSVGVWSRDELADCRVRFRIKKKASGSSKWAYITGADLTVTYTYQNEKFMLKLGGKYNDIARVFKKVNGIWVEQTELENVVDQTKRLVNGGEYVVELPEGYTRVEYIESTGSQYIDTAFQPNQDTRVVCKAVFLPESKAKFLFGARTSATSDQFMFAATSGGVYRSGYGSGYSQFADTYSSDGIIIVDKNKATTALTLPDGTNGTVQETESIFATPCSVVLFAVNNNGSVDSLSKAKLYSCQIYDNGDLIRDYIPCTNASGTVGLYDKVNGVFYSSATSTPFISGPELGGSGSGSSPKLISFTIDGTSYQAENGMTWGQWVNSGYNSGVNPFIIYNDMPTLVGVTYYHVVDTETNDYCYIAEVIKANGTYGLDY